MILTFIRAVGRSALRWKWRWQDRRRSAQLAAQPTVPTLSEIDEIFARLKVTYRSDVENPGYYADPELIRTVSILPSFSAYQTNRYSPPWTLLIGLIGWYDGVALYKQKFAEHALPVPTPPDDPPGYMSLY